jgi:hypothetical protein
MRRDPMEEIICPVCGVPQAPTADCVACGHPLGDLEVAVEPDDAPVAGFDDDELDDVAVEDDDGAGDGPF